MTDTTMVQFNRIFDRGARVVAITDTSVVQINRALEVQSDESN